jgi:hypothetical protein
VRWWILRLRKYDAGNAFVYEGFGGSFVLLGRFLSARLELFRMKSLTKQWQERGANRRGEHVSRKDHEDRKYQRVNVQCR